MWTPEDFSSHCPIKKAVLNLTDLAAVYRCDHQRCVGAKGLLTDADLGKAAPANADIFDRPC